MFEWILLISGVFALLGAIFDWNLLILKIGIALLLIIYGLSLFPRLKEDLRKKGLVVGSIIFMMSGLFSLVMLSWWPLPIGIACGFSMGFLLTTEDDYNSVLEDAPRQAVIRQAVKYSLLHGGRRKVQTEVARRIEQLVEKLTKANQAAEIELTIDRHEMHWVVIAQSIGLMVWEHYGKRLSQQKCITLAQSLVIIELSDRQEKISPSNELFDWYNRAISEQVLAMQASMPVVLCFTGAEDMAKKMVAETLEATQLPTDEAMVAALQRRDGEI